MAAYRDTTLTFSQEDVADRVPAKLVTPGYFQLLGVGPLYGRSFEEADGVPGAAPTVVVDRACAQRFYPGEDAIGKRMTSGGCNQPDCARLTVVGVVGEVKYTGLDDPGRGVVYLAQGQIPFWSGYLFVRTDSESQLVLPSIRTVVRDLDAGLPLTRIATMEELLRDDLASPRNFLALIGAFAAVVLLLAAVGIYGVMAFFVEQHAREIGIRLAVGGQPGSIWRLVVGRALRLAVSGLVVGLVGALVLTRFLTILLFEVSPTDALTYAGTVTLLAATALLACLMPARRAAQLDPVTILRAE